MLGACPARVRRVSGTRAARRHLPSTRASVSITLITGTVTVACALLLAPEQGFGLLVIQKLGACCVVVATTVVRHVWRQQRPGTMAFVQLASRRTGGRNQFRGRAVDRTLAGGVRHPSERGTVQFSSGLRLQLTPGFPHSKDTGRSGRSDREPAFSGDADALRLPALTRAALSLAPALVTVSAQDTSVSRSKAGGASGTSPMNSSAVASWPRTELTTAAFRYTFYSLGSNDNLYKQTLQAEIQSKLIHVGTEGAALIVRVDPSYVAWVDDAQITEPRMPGTLADRVGGRPLSADAHLRGGSPGPYHATESMRSEFVADVEHGTGRKPHFDRAAYKRLDENQRSSRPCPRALTSPYIAGGALPSDEEGLAQRCRLYIEGEVTHALPCNASFHGPSPPECFIVRVLRRCQNVFRQFAGSEPCSASPTTIEESVEDFCIMCSAQRGSAECRSFPATLGTGINVALNALSAT